MSDKKLGTGFRLEGVGDFKIIANLEPEFVELTDELKLEIKNYTDKALRKFFNFIDEREEE